MSIDTATINTLTGAELVSTVADRLRSFPESQRSDALQTILLDLHWRQAAELKYAWSLHARPSQLPPPGDWDTWPNGAFALTYSSHEPDQMRGPQFDAAWCDELASWQYPDQAWDNLNFALRLGRQPRAIVTTTPRHVELVRNLPNSPGVHVTRGTTFDNKDNLPPSFFNQLLERYDGTRIGQQEIYAEIIDQDEDAIWKREWIENARLSSHPPVARIVVSIDPAMSTKPNSSETGIVVVGADMRREHAYVLADESGKLTPNSWALRAAHLFDKFNATRIIAEDNAGGNLVQSTLKAAVDRTIPYKGIKARRGKHIRAEPVAALYEQAASTT